MSAFTRYDAGLSLQYHTQASDLLNKDYWIVIEPFVYRLDSMDSNLYVTVPTGFLTDGASVPRILWNLVPPWGNHGQAAVLHDYLCEFGTITNGHIRLPTARKRIDEIFLQALEVLGVGRFKKMVLSTGVSLYRNVVEPKGPEVNPLKREIEEQIMLGYAHTGSFILTHAQVGSIRSKFKLK